MTGCCPYTDAQVIREEMPLQLMLLVKDFFFIELMMCMYKLFIINTANIAYKLGLSVLILW